MCLDSQEHEKSFISYLFSSGLWLVRPLFWWPIPTIFLPPTTPPANRKNNPYIQAAHHPLSFTSVHVPVPCCCCQGSFMGFIFRSTPGSHSPVAVMAEHLLLHVLVRECCVTPVTQCMDENKYSVSVYRVEYSIYCSPIQQCWLDIEDLCEFYFHLRCNFCVVTEFGFTRDQRRQWLIVHGSAHSFLRSNNWYVGSKSYWEDSRQTTKCHEKLVMWNTPLASKNCLLIREGQGER